MTLTNNLKVQVDLPVWEWMRFAPTATTAVSAITASDQANARYIYYLVASTFYRYDTYSDGWIQLATPVTAPVAAISLRYNPTAGYYGRVISATATTVTAAALQGNVLNGYKIRIISGTGAGQERTITSVADPVVAATGVTTTGAAGTITDTGQAWNINQWRDYQARIHYGTGATQIRKILYNNATSFTTSDANIGAYENNYSAAWVTTPVATAGSQSLFTIESSVITVNTSWTVTPDSTSRFVVESGGIYLISQAAAAPFYSWQYYDIAADVWYQKTVNSNNVLAALGTDFSIERFNDLTTYLSSTATAGAAQTLTDSGQAMALNRYNNYMISITGGTGVGQTRTIIGNTATVFTVSRVWDTNPDATSTYKVFGDYDKILLAGNGNAAKYEYSVEADLWSPSRILDFGSACNAAAYTAGSRPVAITSGSNVTTTATITTAQVHNFKVGDLITVKGFTDANFNVTSVAVATVPSTTTFTYTMGGTPAATTIVNSQGATTLVDASKNWTASEHIGKLVYFTTTVGPGATGVMRKITANTATTLTIASGTPVNGTTKYAIVDIKAFGADAMQYGNLLIGRGVATSGSTTTLVDSTKTWVTNQWAGKKVRIFAGTGVGNEVAVTSNTATTLTYSVQSFTPDTTSYYYVMDTFGTATSGSTTTLVDTGQAWVTNQWAGKRVKITGGTGVGSEVAITSNTATTLTYAVQTFTPDTTTTYSILQNGAKGAGFDLSWCYGTTDTATTGQYIISARGGATNIIDRYNLSTELYDFISTSPQFETFTTGSQYTYDGVDRIYIQKDATGRVYYYDVTADIMQQAGVIPYGMSTAIIGNRMEVLKTTDGLKYLYIMRHTAAEFWRTILFW